MTAGEEFAAELRAHGELLREMRERKKPGESSTHAMLDEILRLRGAIPALEWALGEIDRLARGRDGSEGTLRAYEDAREALRRASQGIRKARNQTNDTLNPEQPKVKQP